MLKCCPTPHEVHALVRKDLGLRAQHPTARQRSGPKHRLQLNELFLAAQHDVSNMGLCWQRSPVATETLVCGTVMIHYTFMLT